MNMLHQHVVLNRKSSFVLAVLRRFFLGMLWLCSFVLLFWACHAKDPHLLALRSYETILLLVLCLVGSVAFRRLYRGGWRTTGVSLLVVAAIVTTTTELKYHYRKKMVLNSNLDIERQLGRHFIVGFSTVEELRPLIETGIVGGIFITQRNAAQKTVEQLRQEIAALQQLRQEAGFAKLIVATDQEGGIVSRLSPPLDGRPSLGALVDKSPCNADLLSQAEAYGRQQGKELYELGVTVNFSPVVDLRPDHAPNALDFYSLIKQRAISDSPTRTTEIALAYVRGMEEQGIRATLKHFPGLGGVATDTHLFSAILETPVEQLASRDWLPFEQVARKSHALIMLSHVVLSHIDRENPVSFSHAVIQGIIRNSWKHEGLLVTDNLTMAAAYNHGLGEVTVKALNAGVDLLLVSYDYEKFYEAMYYAVAAYLRGDLDHNQLERSQRRLEGLLTAEKGLNENSQPTRNALENEPNSDR